ncbi:hypothetical protein LHJ74_08860 [Streptomyces sp. N2-109]|uniref:Uncharacterized protein n=1 Tax=Streptomyces gossypii TaxID=2883101 RepID=A0ABT2JRP8_9ACTN|nr:hypothetical protein [Streptomyces gossypii]MCT2590020.1 hypothetical protein [Streptomyces gossypii]
MSVTQQYALDLYRSTQHGTTPPPAPGTHDWRTVRELRDAHLDSRRLRRRGGDGPKGAGLLGRLARRVTRTPRARRPEAASPSGSGQAQCCA